MTQPPQQRSPQKGAIELDRICKQYSKERVVDGVSAVIEPGEFFSLLGPSGSGKSTTLMMIAGFADVDGGAIRVDGVDIVGVPPQRRGFGMAFQNYAIFPHLNVFENVAFPLRARRMPADEIRGRVDRALELSGGSGVFKHNRLEQLFRDVRMGRFHPPNDMMTHELVGKMCLGVDPDDPQRWG